MRIRYLSPEGVLEVEQAALREIHRQLPGHWAAYAAFQLVPRNSSNPLDVDLVLLTPNRILLVELKNWKGDIEFSEGQWFHKDGTHKSPVLVTTNKARVLEGVLRHKLAGKPVPIIDFVVVLCHPKCRLVSFPEEERKYTLTLSEFCAAYADPKRYLRRHPDVPRRPSPLDDRPFYEGFFSFKNAQVKERRLVFHGFRQVSSKPDYIHPRCIWEEFRAEHIEVRKSGALIRKWNFQALGEGATTAAERITIGLRESTLNERLRIQAPELHADMLEPVAPATPDDITTNFVEAYRLPERIERLAEFLARRVDMGLDERVAVARVVLARFASLHRLGVTHRDITTKTLWIIEPARVILSSFAAARVPEAMTVGLHRVELETGATKLPEDAAPEATKAEPTFARDVFLLGVIVHQLIETTELETVSGVPVFDERSQLHEPRLRHWYAKAMEWDPSSRFVSGQEALDAFNEALNTGPAQLVREDEIDAYRTDLSPLTLPATKKLPSLKGKVVYISEWQGRAVLVKCWPALRYDERKSSRNARVLSFLQQARALRQSGFDAAPEVVDFGVSEMGLILVTRWEDGAGLLDWISSNPTREQTGGLALSFINAVRRLHALGLFHGDVKPGNILVCPDDNAGPRAVLLDVPDLSADGDEGVTPGSLPPALESATPQHRDAYIASEILLSLLEGAFPATRAEALKALAVAEVMPPLDLLAETLQEELFPTIPSLPEYVVNLRRRRREEESKRELIGDDSVFPVGVRVIPDTKEVIFYVTGLRQQLVLKCSGDYDVREVFVKDIGHDDYVLAARRSAFRLSATITLAYAEVVDAGALVGALLPRFEATKADTTEAQPLGTSSGDPYRETEVGETHGDSNSTRALWDALAATDELNASQITLRAGARRTPEDDWVVPYDIDDGTIDFADEERIEVLERGSDALDGTERWFVVAIVKDLGKDLLHVTPTSFRFSPKPGKTYFLRGSFERFASERRVAAMRRVLAGGALIPALLDYFEPASERPPRESAFPSSEELARYALNPIQAEALQTALRYGPVSLLQGPPGTGKTKFIASFVHYLLDTGSSKNILLVSQSHDAVNNALQKVRELAAGTSLDVSMVRVGRASMVPDLLRPIQEDARRQSYREHFAAEIKERVRDVGYGMGLPRSYVDVAVEAQTSLGDLLERIDSLRATSEENDDDPKAANHIAILKNRFQAIAESKFALSVDVSGDLRGQLEAFLDAVAQQNAAPSPDKRRRLDLIVQLSTEFSHVLRNPRSNFTAFLARSAQLVAGTCVGVGKNALGITETAYDWVIVDEAARASPMELVVAMQCGRRVLLVGDHLQLPPTYSLAIQDKTAQILGIGRRDFRSINSFQRAFFSTYGKCVGRTLLKQYRMADSISRLVSNCFYDKALTVGRTPPGAEYRSLPSYLSREVVWVDTAQLKKEAYHRPLHNSDDGALVNEAEANLVVSIVRDLVLNEDLVQHVRASKEAEPIVGVISMYAAQRDLIRKKLDQADWASDARDLFTVGTVDSYQGKENRIIVLSVVRNDEARGIGFLRDPERINVAMSRAKDRLVILSSTAMWSGRSGTPMHNVLGELRDMEKEGQSSFIASHQIRIPASHEATV